MPDDRESKWDLAILSETLSGKVKIPITIPVGICILGDSIDYAALEVASHYREAFIDAVSKEFERLKQTRPEIFAKLERYWQSSEELHNMHNWNNDRQRFERTNKYDLDRGLELLAEQRSIVQEILGFIPEDTEEAQRDFEQILREAVPAEAPVA